MNISFKYRVTTQVRDKRRIYSVYELDQRKSAKCEAIVWVLINNRH